MFGVKFENFGGLGYLLVLTGQCVINEKANILSCGIVKVHLSWFHIVDNIIIKLDC